jgi:ATP-binding cassette subfamily F protein uup
MIQIGTGRRHVVGYLKDFLFSGDQITGPVTKLSGGERRRLQLAKVLSRPCNILVLDEPTNDLDLETLELLEDLLIEFGGTLLVVSHDRAFLDSIVTSTIVFEGAGRWREYVGGYEDWLRQREPEVVPPSPKRAAAPARSTPRPRRATFKEKREHEQLPGTIERLEAEKQELHDAMSSPGYYRTPADEMARMKDRLTVMDAEIQRAYDRWAELEEIVGGES